MSFFVVMGGLYKPVYVAAQSKERGNFFFSCTKNSIQALIRNVYDTHIKKVKLWKKFSPNLSWKFIDETLIQISDYVQFICESDSLPQSIKAVKKISHKDRHFN
jgi:hypothetical protein